MPSSNLFSIIANLVMFTYHDTLERLAVYQQEEKTRNFEECLETIYFSLYSIIFHY